MLALHIILKPTCLASQCSMTTLWYALYAYPPEHWLTFGLQNAGIAIFTLLGSQLIGYGFAGLLQDVLVKPTKCFWPASSTSHNTLLAAVQPDDHRQSKRLTCSRLCIMTSSYRPNACVSFGSCSRSCFVGKLYRSVSTR